MTAVVGGHCAGEPQCSGGQLQSNERMARSGIPLCWTGDGNVTGEPGEDFPAIEYPHALNGYEWQLQPSERPEMLFSGSVSRHLILKIAKEACAHKEIWENLSFEEGYHQEYGHLVEEGIMDEAYARAAADMLRSFYAAYVVRHSIPNAYTYMSQFALLQLVRYWISQNIDPKNDAVSSDVIKNTDGIGEDK